ncbi:unnamed protein product [Hydatigera taeniaeformis]|uniref:Uncharacterized protein n=1 Tax=Hydatigena taeniaeformis TaxID=6205 RepID=A0A0R3XBD5_HYDTA|nr:unnamed protein product [Hydatigera taeniaeformis]
MHHVEEDAEDEVGQMSCIERRHQWYKQYDGVDGITSPPSFTHREAKGGCEAESRRMDLHGGKEWRGLTTGFVAVGIGSGEELETKQQCFARGRHDDLPSLIVLLLQGEQRLNALASGSLASGIDGFCAASLTQG